MIPQENDLSYAQRKEAWWEESARQNEEHMQRALIWEGAWHSKESEKNIAGKTTRVRSKVIQYYTGQAGQDKAT